MTEDLATVEAFGIAIRAELDASEIYAELGKRVGNAFLQQKILLVGKEELQHKRILEEVYNSRFPEIPLDLPRSRLPTPLSCRTMRSQMSVREMLFSVIEQERRSHEFYVQTSGIASDIAGKALFSLLADWEFSHEMQLSAEYEMVVRYPGFYEHAVEMWKPDFCH
jgi:rubrerythrin